MYDVLEIVDFYGSLTRPLKKASKIWGHGESYVRNTCRDLIGADQYQIVDTGWLKDEFSDAGYTNNQIKHVMELAGAKHYFDAFSGFF